MHPALFIAVRSTRRRAEHRPARAGSRRAAVAGAIAVLAAGGALIADSQASGSPSGAGASHFAGPPVTSIVQPADIRTAGAIVAPGRFGWQAHCPRTARQGR
jgi:hypothetical protein